MRKFKTILLIILLSLAFIPRIFAEINEDSEFLQKSAIKNILKNELSERGAWGLRQGAWFLKKGEFYTEVYSKYYWHNQQFDSDGNKHRWAYDGKYLEKETEAKLEYGLTNKHTLMVSVNYKDATWEDAFKRTSTSGFVYARPGLKYLLFEEPYLAYLQFKMKIPLGFDEHTTPSLGTNQIDGEIKLMTAQPWPKLPGYTKLEFGFRGRREEPTNEIIYFAQFAYNISDNILMEFGLDGQKGLPRTGSALPEDWTKLTIGPVFRVGFLNLKFGYGKILFGKNTSASDEIYSAIYGWF